MTTDQTDVTDKNAISKELLTVARPLMCQSTERVSFIRVIGVIRGSFWDVVYSLSVGVFVSIAKPRCSLEIPTRMG